MPECSTTFLRHGDLLSSLLFVIVTEALSKILSVAVDGGLVPSISMGYRNVGGFHIPIAHDTLLFVRQTQNIYVIYVPYSYALLFVV